MGRYIGPTNKIARRFGINLGLKVNPAKVARRLTQPPGVHGTKRRRVSTSSYSKQLIEKQKVKYIYGIRERQLRRYVDEAIQRKGDSSVYLQQILERRLDNVVYRLGFAVTRAQARQLVSHGLFAVGGKKLNIPSYLVKVGDVIACQENKVDKKIFTGLEERLTKANLPAWLTVDSKTKAGKVTNQPQEKDFDKVFDIKFIIEYYSSR